jgi:hypothetical protein
MEPDKPGTRRSRRKGEGRLVRAELALLLADLAEVESTAAGYDDEGPAGVLSLVIARVARRAIAAGQLTELELGRLVLDAGPAQA